MKLIGFLSSMMEDGAHCGDSVGGCCRDNLQALLDLSDQVIFKGRTVVVEAVTVVVIVGTGNLAEQKLLAGWKPWRIEATPPGTPPLQRDVVVAMAEVMSVGVFCRAAIVSVFQDKATVCTRESCNTKMMNDSSAVDTYILARWTRLLENPTAK